MRYLTGERVDGASKAHGSLRRPLVDDLESPICTDCLRGSGAVAPSAPAMRPVSPAAHMDLDFEVRAPFSA